MSDLPRTRTQRVLLLALGLVGAFVLTQHLGSFFHGPRHIERHVERHVEIRIAHPPAPPLPPMPPLPPAPPAPPSF